MIHLQLARSLIEINRSWTYHAITQSPQTIVIGNLPADGRYQNVFVKFTGVDNCTKYERGLYRSPRDCGDRKDLTTDQLSDRLLVYPNPNNGEFNLLLESASDQKLKLEVINALGQVLTEKEIETNMENKLDLKGLPEGYYYLRIEGSKEPHYEQITDFEIENL